MPFLVGNLAVFLAIFALAFYQLPSWWDLQTREVLIAICLLAGLCCLTCLAAAAFVHAARPRKIFIRDCRRSWRAAASGALVSVITVLLTSAGLILFDRFMSDVLILVIASLLSAGCVTLGLCEKVKAGCCRRCDYDLRAQISGRCPECALPEQPVAGSR